MGIRIMINWEFMSPLLRVAKGTCRVEYIRITGAEMIGQSKTLLEFKISKKDGQIGFKEMSNQGIPTALFERVAEHVKLMADSYFKGMILDDMSFHWVESSFDKPLEEWLKETEPKGNEKCITG